VKKLRQALVIRCHAESPKQQIFVPHTLMPVYTPLFRPEQFDGRRFLEYVSVATRRYPNYFLWRIENGQPFLSAVF
jgi:hypothetical protein